MERFTVEVRDDVADAFRERAAANGNSVEDELADLVRNRTAPSSNRPALIDRLIAIVGDDAEIYLPSRELMDREPLFTHDDFS